MDSTYMRRVAISLRVPEFAYEHDARSVFAVFDALRQIDPLGRIPRGAPPCGAPRPAP